MNTNRYEVMADYPSSHIPVGDIVHAFTDALDAFYSKYPHLFRLLKWWEHVPVDELPKYVKVKSISPTGLYKVDKWVKSNSHIGEYYTVLHNGNANIQVWTVSCYPATEAEYNEYLNKLNSK